MMAILRWGSLFLGMYGVSATLIALATGSLMAGLVTAFGTSVGKFIFTFFHHKVWHWIDHKPVPEAEVAPVCVFCCGE